jgi:hypothetical protein
LRLGETLNFSFSFSALHLVAWPAVFQVTKYEHTKAHNQTLSLIQSIVGSGPNVIQSISTSFTEGKPDPNKTNTLAAEVAELLDQVNADANAITAWEIAGEK